MTRPVLDPLDALVASETPPPDGRAAWLRACFAPVETLLDADTCEDGDEPGWHPIAFWWPTTVGVQLVLMPCRSLVQ